ncbi:DUF2637 domain-containing protein [Actinoallomurus bryophytorum]|uniref:Uncharacterized protein DUF2637 n=1 Tax=Actinoallomurus bryophytorum TaxID=1490222 RepID=A0A543CG89_9ACTN|nr:DUF2637 domain-containing protein [Actinoallomurus bryophytorum]TQL96129.1 uncharacterized protein DUF2637 [Actinoallomurus bryophytorum]
MSTRRKIAAVVVDSGPVAVLAGIAGAGSFTHIRDTANEHGQHGPMAWAIAVCIDLTCVMAARERQRDRRTGRTTRRVSWPALVLAGGVLLSLAANLAQAETTVWGWLTAATPAGAFLVAISMIERRSTGQRPASSSAVLTFPIPPSFGKPQDEPQDEAPRQGELVPVPDQPPSSTTTPGDPLVAYARRVATEHQDRHGRPITRDALRARLGVSNQLASDLLRQIRTA